MREWWDRWRAPARFARCAPIDSVLVLCTANRVRSPFAEQVLRARLPADVTVMSRGLLPGNVPCPPDAIDVAAALRTSLADHMARQLTPPELLSASVVLSMERQVAITLGTRFPAIRSRILPLGWFDPEPGWGVDIADPFMLTRTDYFDTYERIVRCCDVVARHVRKLPRS